MFDLKLDNKPFALFHSSDAIRLIPTITPTRTPHMPQQGEGIIMQAPNYQIDDSLITLQLFEDYANETLYSRYENTTYLGRGGNVKYFEGSSYMCQEQTLDLTARQIADISYYSDLTFQNDLVKITQRAFDYGLNADQSYQVTTYSSK